MGLDSKWDGGTFLGLDGVCGERRAGSKQGSWDGL